MRFVDITRADFRHWPFIGWRAPDGITLLNPRDAMQFRYGMQIAVTP